MSASGSSVLIVDNDEAFLQLTTELLKQNDPFLQVRTARSGAEALAVLKRGPQFESSPHTAFIILDFRLPDFDAPEVLRRIRAIEGGEAIPVLVLSQGGWAEDEAASLAAGALQFGVKPSRIELLEEILVSFWRNHAGGYTKGFVD